MDETTQPARFEGVDSEAIGALNEGGRVPVRFGQDGPVVGRALVHADGTFEGTIEDPGVARMVASHLNAYSIGVSPKPVHRD